MILPHMLLQGNHGTKGFDIPRSGRATSAVHADRGFRFPFRHSSEEREYAHFAARARARISCSHKQLVLGADDGEKGDADAPSNTG